MNPQRLVRLLTLLAVTLGTAAAQAADLRVYFFDVGQGDAALVVSPAGKTVLIDAGPPEAAESLALRLKTVLSAPVDLVLLTHAHADHLGGMERVVQAVGARIFMEPGYDHPSPVYEQLLRTLEDKKVPVKLAEAGRNVDLGGGATLRLLSPFKPALTGTRSDVNANCAVARLTYGKTAVHFGCDSEKDTEERLLQGPEPLAANVYKVAHHGGRHSSTRPLLERMKPEIAVVSVGAGNDYGHPTRQAIGRLEAAGARVFRTDLDGEILVESDGRRVTVRTQRGGEEAPAPAVVEAKAVEPARATPEPLLLPPPRKLSDAKSIDDAFDLVEPSAPAPAGFVTSSNSDAFHKPDCPNAARIKPENLASFPTREAALAAGKRPAKDCNP